MARQLLCNLCETTSWLCFAVAMSFYHTHKFCTCHGLLFHMHTQHRVMFLHPTQNLEVHKMLTLLHNAIVNWRLVFTHLRSFSSFPLNSCQFARILIWFFVAWLSHVLSFHLSKAICYPIHRWCIASWSATQATKIKRLELGSLECSMLLNMCNAQQWDKTDKL